VLRLFRFAVSVAISTRVGNLLGATLDDAARTAANVGMLVSSSIGLLNGYSLSSSSLAFLQFLDVPYIFGGEQSRVCFSCLGCCFCCVGDCLILAFESGSVRRC
jgi:hypothetical protein